MGCTLPQGREGRDLHKYGFKIGLFFVIAALSFRKRKWAFEWRKEIKRGILLIY